jgi:hypothetical protein
VALCVTDESSSQAVALRRHTAGMEEMNILQIKNKGSDLFISFFESHYFVALYYGSNV